MFDSKPHSDPQTTIVHISPAERERERSLRERFAQFWGTATGEIRDVYDRFVAEVPLTEDVSLEPVNDDRVRGWWVRPPHAEASRAILYLHGGAYVLGSAQAYRGFVSQIVSRTRVPALVLDYPLAPEAPLPAAPLAAQEAYTLLTQQGFERVALVGDSAGGGLALVTLAELVKQRRGAMPIAGVVFSPWTDLALTGASLTDPSVVDPLLSYELLQDSSRKYVNGHEPTNPLASPLYADLRRLPPLLIQVGTDERLLDDSRQFTERARRAGVSAELEIWEGMHHVFQRDVEHLESSRNALDRAARFLRKTLKS
ncbi:MAG TPA: alpha/beta hydrolase [Polyangiaceae bacterium]|nr:alpha/beta hydrolase [Polyangiaceae bacterium]